MTNYTGEQFWLTKNHTWETTWPGQLADYPPFECGATMGEDYNVCCIQASIYCPVGIESTTWGTIKELYK